MRSSARRSFTRIPFRADSAVEIEITSGIARPESVGQAMTRTVTVRSTALRGLAEHGPHDEGDEPRGGGDVEEERGRSIRQCLRSGLRALRLCDQTLDAGERRVVTDRVDLDPDGGVGGNRSRGDPIAFDLA